MAKLKNIEFCKEYLTNDKMIAVLFETPQRKKSQTTQNGQKPDVLVVIKKYTHGGVDLRIMFNKKEVHLMDVTEALLNHRLRMLMFDDQHVNEPKPIAIEQ